MKSALVVGQKLVSVLLTLLLVSLLIFLIFQVIPGDAVLARLGLDADPALEALLREEMRLDQPYWRRYLLWLNDLLQGDLGASLRFGRPVATMIADSLPNTVALATLSFIEVLALGIPLGLWLYSGDHTDGSDAGKGFLWRCRRFVAGLVRGLMHLLLAIPVFALAIILMLVFAVWLRWLPLSGYVSWSENFPLFMYSLILPSFAISLPSVAMVIRYLLTSLQEQSSLAYTRTALSKGLSSEQTLKRHMLRNALVPVLTILGVILINTLGGSIVVEATFGIPGIGQLLNTAIRSRDLPLVQGISFYIALVVTLGYLLLDLLYMAVDPRISS